MHMSLFVNNSQLSNEPSARGSRDHLTSSSDKSTLSLTSFNIENEHILVINCINKYMQTFKFFNVTITRDLG